MILMLLDNVAMHVVTLECRRECHHHKGDGCGLGDDEDIHVDGDEALLRTLRMMRG